MQWHTLTEAKQLESIQVASFDRPQLIFKHSTRCGTSDIAKYRLEQSFTMLQNQYTLWYLDVIRFKQLSADIAGKFQEIHESPQVLVIQNNACTLAQSHFEIDSEELLAFVES